MVNIDAETAVIIRESETAKQDVVQAEHQVQDAIKKLGEAKRERERARHKARNHLASKYPHTDACAVYDTNGGYCDCGANLQRKEIRRHAKQQYEGQEETI